MVGSDFDWGLGFALHLTFGPEPFTPTPPMTQSPPQAGVVYGIDFPVQFEASGTSAEVRPPCLWRPQSHF